MLRGERSSANGSASAYYLYPKIAAAYNFPNLLGSGSNVKLRADEGITGNQPLFGQKYTLLQSNTAIGGVTATGLGTNAGASLRRCQHSAGNDARVRVRHRHFGT